MRATTRKKSRKRRAAAVLLLIAALFMMTACGAKDSRIRFGTAGIGGGYYSFGQSFAGFLNAEDDSLSVEVRVTAGSAANLRLLSGKYVQLALAQTDVITDLYNGTGTAKGNDPVRGYSAIAGLYTEACQIVTAESSGISGVRDLRGRKVSVGEKDSGSERNAMQILQAYGINADMFDVCYYNYTEAAKALKAGDIDAFFCTAGVQTTVIEELAKETGIRLLSVDGTEARALLETYPCYQSYTIPAGTYTGVGEDVGTVGVKSVLLAGDELPEAAVSKITESLFNHADELQLAVPVRFTLDESSAVKDIPIPFHPGAAAYYKSKGISVGSAS